MTRERLEPAKYLEFYRSGLRCFLPVSVIEDFRLLVSNSLDERRRDWDESLRKAEATWSDSDNPWQAFKLRCYNEARLNELTELQLLADELAILDLYRFIEIERNRVLLEQFTRLDRSRLANFDYLAKTLPFLMKLFGSAAIDERRLICNGIKHSGRVSRALALCNPEWHVDEPLAALGTTYDRLAPFVHAYWVDLVQTARDVGEKARDIWQRHAEDGPSRLR